MKGATVPQNVTDFKPSYHGGRRERGWKAGLLPSVTIQITSGLSPALKQKKSTPTPRNTHPMSPKIFGRGVGVEISHRKAEWPR